MSLGTLTARSTRCRSAPSSLGDATDRGRGHGCSLSASPTRPGHEFWPNAAPYAQVDLSAVLGHRQVTDAYLVALARRRGPQARLATLDDGLAQLYPATATLIGAPA